MQCEAKLVSRHSESTVNTGGFLHHSHTSCPCRIQMSLVKNRLDI